MLIYLYIEIKVMHKWWIIFREFLSGRISIESVGKSPVSRPPGDVTQIPHN